ncbi:MAG: hypothetical protein HYY00_02430 [Chloroflexi bacterium]|nr:hypothetical protein [Chloroflexota bacterium]
MTEQDERIAHAIQHTRVVRPPRQILATFGTTTIHYYLVTEPVYSELPKQGEDTVIREGTVTSERPRVVTPYYLAHLEGFGESARRYAEEMARQHGSQAPGLLYSYRNETKETSIVSGRPPDVARRIGDDLDTRQEKLAAVIAGVDELWDVSLLKFMFELTSASVVGNVTEMHSRGLLAVDREGLPQDARAGIERLFHEVREGNMDPSVLKRELDQWGVFHEYEDRFMALFHRR